MLTPEKAFVGLQNHDPGDLDIPFFDSSDPEDPCEWYFNREGILTVSSVYAAFIKTFPQFSDAPIPSLRQADLAMLERCREIYRINEGLVPFSPVQFVDGWARAYEVEWIEADFDILRCPDWWDMPF